MRRRRFIRIAIWYHRNAERHLKLAFKYFESNDRMMYLYHMDRYEKLHQFFDIALEAGIEQQRQIKSKLY